MWGITLRFLFSYLTEWCNGDVSSVSDGCKCFNICCWVGNWLVGTAFPEWLVVKIDCSWAFASLENNSEPSIEEQARELILVCGSGQQLWLHQGPIRDCVCPARLTPAGVYVSAPLQETGGGGKGCGRFSRCFLSWKYVGKHSRIVTGQWKVMIKKGCLGRRFGQKMSSSYWWCWPQFSKASPSRDLPSLPIIFLLMLPLKRPPMMDDFWWALLYLAGLWLTLFLSTALHVTVLMWFTGSTLFPFVVSFTQMTHRLL